MVQTIVLALLAGLVGLWLAKEFVPGVDFTGDLKSFLIAGIVLGIIIAVLRPLLNLVSLLLKIVILAAVLFGVLWVLDVLFPEIDILGLTSLLWTTLAVGGATIILFLLGKGKL